MKDDIYFMSEALRLAQKAFELNEVPVGALIVDSEENIIGRGLNLKETTKMPVMHAEMVAIISAHKNKKMMYLSGCTLYTTLEPCPMCAGALVNERITRIVFATEDNRYGACGSVYNLSFDNNLNHKIQVVSGVLREESVALIKRFFGSLREKDA